MPKENLVRILQVQSCPTLSQSSTITYHIGCNDKPEILFRIYATSGGGTFSKEWVTLKSILQHLKKQDKDITSITLYPLFRGKSVNTPSFLLAVMKHEGLVATMKGKRRNHELLDPKPFIERINQLIESDVDLDPDTKPKRTPIRQRASTPKKKTAAKGARSRKAV